MSARTQIVDALVDKLKEVDGTGAYNSVLQNVFGKMVFFDEINDYPTLCVVAGYETREYLPSDFQWGWLNISIKIYVEDENPQHILEHIIADIELLIAENQELIYAPEDARNTTEIQISSIQTDEGVLTPLGVGEINLIVRYQVFSHNP